jgi:hypothetical protein
MGIGSRRIAFEGNRLGREGGGNTIPASASWAGSERAQAESSITAGYLAVYASCTSSINEPAQARAT